MNNEITTHFEEDIQQIIAASRLLAIDARHSFITLEHFFVAMLQVYSKAKTYLTAFEANKHIDWLKKLYDNTGRHTTDDNVPLTLHAERIIKHTWHLSAIKQQPLANSVHLLLAMLSYENNVSKICKKKGLLFEDIADSYFTDGLPKTPIRLQLRQFRKSSFLERLFRTDPGQQKLLKEIHQHALALWTYQQYDDCMITCYTGLVISPGHKEFGTLLSACLIRKRDYKNAVIILQELVAAFPYYPNYRIDLAFCHDREGDHGKAEAIMDELLPKIPDNYRLLNNKGFNLFLQGKYAESVPFYEQAIKLAPSFAYPLDNLGFVKHKLGHTEEALTLIDQSLELDKGNAYAYKYKGIIFLDKGDKAQALHNFELAIRYGYTKTYGEEVVHLIKQSR